MRKSPFIFSLLPIVPMAFALLSSPLTNAGTPTPMPAAEAPADDHTLTFEATPTKAGTAGALAISIAPKSPWKWNPEYPAKLELVAPPGVTFDKGLLSKKDNDFAASGKTVGATAAFKATSPGTHTAVVKGKFGLCDANVCIIKKVETTATIVVK